MGDPYDGFEYAGALQSESDGDDGEYAQPVYSCRVCFGLVAGDCLQFHREWHG
jgi:hypothetical protein